jgi:hypothetical protein
MSLETLDPEVGTTSPAVEMLSASAPILQDPHRSTAANPALANLDWPGRRGSGKVREV